MRAFVHERRNGRLRLPCRDCGARDEGSGNDDCHRKDDQEKHRPMKPWTHRSSLDDLEVSHHTHVLVLQVVAMENVASAITRKSNQDVRGLSGTEIDGVFPTLIVGTRPATVSQDLEVNQMKMQGMVEIRLQPPDFHGVQLGPRIHAGRIERVAVYPPAMAGTPIAEIKNASDHRIFGVREGN